VPFEVIPAIDVWNGRLAASGLAGPVPLEAFDGDPVAAARSFAGKGARRIHVVDLNLAYEGRAANTAVLGAVGAATPGVVIQASGGVRTSGDVDRLLEAGADVVVLGSGALDDELAVEAILERATGRLIVGIETAGGRIRSRGADPVDLDLMSTLGWLVAVGAPAFVVTAIDRVSGLGGPDVALVRRVVRAGRPVLAAGGVASVDDLVTLRGAGAVGALVGRAALGGGLDIAAAIEATAV
jgi:phosphoribosylformimino-5-aminoimidazole carboxamide ribotide isomerase